MEIKFTEIEQHLNDSKKQKLETTLNGICKICNKPFSVGFYSVFRKKDFSEICHNCKLSAQRTVERWDDIYINNDEDIDTLLERISKCESPTAWKTTNVVFTCKKCNKERRVQLKSFIKNASLVCASCRSIETNEAKYGFKTSFSNSVTQDKAREKIMEKYGGVGLSSKDIKERALKTNLERYGATNPLARGTEPFNKRNNTVLEKYNVSNVFQDNSIKDKIRKTWISNYGVDNPSKSEIVLKKIEATNIEKFGVSWSMQSKDVQDKVKSTNIERYGNEYVMGSDYFKEKSKQTCLEKYGVTNPLKSSEIQRKIKSSNLEKYGVEYYSQTDEFAKRRVSKFLFNSINFDSSWELAFYIYCIDNNKSISKPTKSFTYEYQGKIHYYYPDFDVDGQLYEIKGNQFFKDDGTMQNPYDHSLDGLFEAKHSCGLRNNVIFVTGTDIKKYVDYVNTKYTNDFIGLFKKDIPFPYLNGDFTDKSDMGVIHYYHKSIYKATRKGKLSPYEAWKDKSLILKSALNRLKYIGRCEPLDVAQGFNVAKIAPKVSVFKPTLAKKLIEKYLNTFDTIFDPFSGFSGRLIGSINCNKKYIGQDINEDHVRESNEIILYKNCNKTCFVSVANVLTDTQKSFDNTCLFTCPPYGGKEHWNENNDEVEKTCDEWIDICLEKYKCQKYLFVVDDTEKYKDRIVEVLENKSHFGSNKEFVILI